jgi:hypothetical protein
MGKQNLNFSLSKEGFEELLKYLPYKKIIYLFFLTGTLLISISGVYLL